jgi:hypothetical protein
MKLHLLSGSLISALVLVGITACSDDGTTTTTSSDSTVAGQIAGFGSIVMSNGKEYNTDNVTSCEVDDTDVGGVCEDSLSVGMYITMQLDSSGAVSSVHYDDDLEGTASNVSGTDGNFSFNVFDVVTVTTTSPGTQWEGFDTNPPLSTELDGANVEVSGEWQGTELVASYVEKESDTNSEVEGSVGTVDGTAFPLTLNNGGTLNVDASGANLIPQAGDYVEVEGSYDLNTDILMATRIELEDEDEFDEDGEAEITGTLLQDSDSMTDYSINSTQVDISKAPSCTNLVGSVVEAEGVYDQTAGVLVVEECEDEDDELEMTCQIVSSPVVPDPVLSPKVGTVECDFLNTTGGPLTVEFRDSPELAEFSGDDSIDHFDLTDIVAGDCVEIEASMDTTGALVAGLVELEDEGTSGCDSYELASPVDAITADVSITVLGITYTLVNGVTELPDGTPAVGDSAKIKDDNADGVADSVEIEDTEGTDDSDDNNDS